MKELLLNWAREWVEAEGHVVRQAPISFSLAVVLLSVILGVIVWYATSAYYAARYEGTISALKERGEYLQDRVTQLQNDFSRSGQSISGVQEQYAVVGKDGEILLKTNFGAYGLFVEKIDFEGYPAYILTFDKGPDEFKIEPRIQEGVTVEVKEAGPKRYRVQFISSGFGAIPVECNFIVRVL